MGISQPSRAVQFSDLGGLDCLQSRSRKRHEGGENSAGLPKSSLLCLRHHDSYRLSLAGRRQALSWPPGKSASREWNGALPSPRPSIVSVFGPDYTKDVSASDSSIGKGCGPWECGTPVFGGTKRVKSAWAIRSSAARIPSGSSR